jgi:hypothetical protein
VRKLLALVLLLPQIALADSHVHIRLGCANNGDGSVASPCSASPGGVGPYSSFANWETGDTTDVDAANEDRYVHVSCNTPGTPYSEAAVTVAGRATSNADRLIFYGPNDNSFRGAAPVVEAADCVITNASNSTILTIQDENVDIYGFTFKLGTSGFALVYSTLDAGSQQNVKNNTFYSAGTNSASNSGAISVNDSDITFTMENNVFAGFANAGAGTGYGQHQSAASATVTGRNNTFFGNDIAVNDGGANYLYTSNIFQNNTTDINGTEHASNNYNLSDNAGPLGGAQSQNSVELDFTNTGTYDFRLATADVEAIDDGTTHSYAFDQLGTARPQGAAWDLGAFEFPESSADLISLLHAAGEL